jgi:hypothetical protein
VRYRARENLDVCFGRASSNRDSLLNEIPKRSYFCVSFMQNKAIFLKLLYGVCYEESSVQGVLRGIFGIGCTTRNLRYRVCYEESAVQGVLGGIFGTGCATRNLRYRVC